MNHRHKWTHKNLTLLAIGIIFAIVLSRLEVFHQALLNLENWGYIGAFVAGMLFVVTFTAASGAVVLFVLSEKLSPLEIGLIAGTGAVISDVIIFRFLRDDLLLEIKPWYDFLGGNHLTKVLHTKYFSWTLPVIGAIIIASPMPDELGVSLMGISKMKTYQFIALSFFLNFIGIFAIVSLSSFIKP